MASQLPSRPSVRSSQRPTRDAPSTRDSDLTGDVQLTATKPTETTPTPSAADDQQPSNGLRYGWQLVAVGGALTAALAGWILVSGLSVVGWLAAALSGSAGDMADAFRTGTSIWLLTNGAPLELGGVHWSLIPLGMSLLTVFMISRFARAAARFAAPWGDDFSADEDEQDEQDEQDDGLGVAGRLLLGIVGLSTVGYAAVVAAVGLGTGVEITRGTIGAALIAALGSGWGASRGLGVRLSEVLPRWARPLPTAVAAGVGILLLSGVAVLATGVVLHADRIGSLAAGLGAGAVGGIALWAAQAAFLPNLIAWGASYALGGGFRLGQGSVVAPSEVTVGLLPSFPVLGALPSTGPGSAPGLLWLGFGVAAGAVAAALVVRRRPSARVDETALVGGLAGLLAGLVFTGLSWISTGDLGSGRLTGFGPRMLELVVMSGTLLGLSGLLCGLVLGLVRLIREVRARSGSTSEAADSADQEITEAITIPDSSVAVNEADEPTAKVAVRRTAANTGDDDTSELKAELDAADPGDPDKDRDLAADPRAGAEPDDAEATVQVEDRRTA